MENKQGGHISGMAMIRIDGAEVRRLRESKGLTQLYLATAVGVTTDTISRWENGRYPSIKHENGLKLAEALEVNVQDILEREQEEGKTEDQDQAKEAIPAASDEPVFEEQVEPPRYKAVFVAVLFLVFGFLGWFLFSNGDPVPLKSIRHLPDHSPPGRPFPVLVEVMTSGDVPVPLLIREQLPPGVTLLASVPEATSAGGNTVKWLQKLIGANQRFGYLVRYTGEMSGSVDFSGDAALRQGKKLSVATEGNHKFFPAPYHYADINRDYHIDDDEILAVYDEFAGLAGFDVGMDEIEEIWMGSGYRWNEEQGQFEILP